MNNLPFVDQGERDYLREQEAAEQRAHLHIVREYMAGGEEGAQGEVARLALDYAEATDSTNFIIARFAATSDNFPDFSKRVRCFVDAVIGATGGVDEFVEVTDEQLAARMGCSTKTVQNARNGFRSWPGHTKLVEVKEHWRHADTHESHPHAYRCHVTRLSAESTLDARLSAHYGAQPEGREKALKESARVTADSAKGFVVRPPKRRRRPTDSEMVANELKRAGELLQRAASRQPFARNVNPDELHDLRDELLTQLRAFEEAYGLEPSVSIQEDKERSMETPAPAAPPDDPDPARRMEAESQVESEVESPQVESFSTCNDSIESTTYENRPVDFSAANPAEFVKVSGASVEVFYPPGSPPELEEAIYAEACRLEDGLRVWDRLTGGLREGVPDGGG
jgi:hypothetical protein